MLQTSEPYIRIGRYSEWNNLLEISIGSLTSVKDICNSLKEGFVNDKVIEMTETNLYIINFTWSVMKNRSPSKKLGNV